MSTEKRSVSTDALETLGSIISENEKRDAIHIAVEPAIAVQILRPGQDVGFVEGGFGVSRNPVGIVDPFLKQNVMEGERFWLLVYPRQITSLRHVWSHPAFAEAEVYAEPVDNDRQKSEEWLRDWCKREYVNYNRFLGVLEDYDGGKYIHTGDMDMSGNIDDDFIRHAEIVMGRKFTERPEYFSCAC